MAGVLFIVAISVTVFIVYLSCLCLYRLFVHPRARYPGPKRAAVSEIWYAAKWTSGHYHVTMEATHRKYGDVVRIAPNELSFATVQAYRDIYGHATKDKKLFVKGPFYDAHGDNPGIVAVRDPAQHSRQRKYLAHAFSAKALRSQEFVIHQYVDLFVSQLGRIGHPSGGGVNIEEAFNWVTFDIIGDLAFGEAFDAVSEGRTNFWVSLIVDAVYYAMLGSLRQRLPIINLVLPFILPKGAASMHEKHMELTQEKMAKRLEMGDSLKRDDFFSHLLRKGGSDISEPEMRQQAYTLIVAGSETTATCLTGLAFCLLTNKTCLARLSTEIRSEFQSATEITGESTAKLRYLHAVIEESLRIFPPAPFGLQRVCPGAVVDGQYVPPGTVVSVDHWTTKHEPRYWKDPYSFVPERWLDEGSDTKEASHPFSMGPRACLGINLAYLELRIIVAKMVLQYDWELVNKDLDFFEEAKLFLLWKKPEVLVRFYPVN